jgi:hypothetical protein
MIKCDTERGEEKKKFFFRISGFLSIITAGNVEK